jgi:hypothetical protein
MATLGSHTKAHVTPNLRGISDDPWGKGGVLKPNTCVHIDLTQFNIIDQLVEARPFLGLGVR